MVAMVHPVAQRIATRPECCLATIKRAQELFAESGLLRDDVAATFILTWPHPPTDTP